MMSDIHTILSLVVGWPCGCRCHFEVQSFHAEVGQVFSNSVGVAWREKVSAKLPLSATHLELRTFSLASSRPQFVPLSQTLRSIDKRYDLGSMYNSRGGRGGGDRGRGGFRGGRGGSDRGRGGSRGMRTTENVLVVRIV